MKKSATDDLDELRARLLANVQEDRARISTFLDGLLEVLKSNNDPFQTLAAAESMPKIADALTRQNALLVNAMSLAIKEGRLAQDDDEVLPDVGSPFQDEVSPSGSN